MFGMIDARNVSLLDFRYNEQRIWNSHEMVHYQIVVLTQQSGDFLLRTSSRNQPWFASTHSEQTNTRASHWWDNAPNQKDVGQSDRDYFSVYKHGMNRNATITRRNYMKHVCRLEPRVIFQFSWIQGYFKFMNFTENFLFSVSIDRIRPGHKYVHPA